MRRTAMIAVVVCVVAGCAGGPPTASQPAPIASPVDTVTPTPAAVAASTPPPTRSPSPAATSPAQTAPTTPGFNPGPALAATTGWIAYQAGSTADLRRERIRVVRPDGTDDHELFGDIPYTKHMHPAWSPDGQQIAFGVEEGGPDRVYVANADGSDARLLTDCRNEDCVGFGHPAWSPDGSTIAVRYDGGAGADGVPTQLGLALVDVASGDYEIISLQGSEYQDIYPRWSPDGRQLVFWREQAGADGEQVGVFTMNIDGTDVRQLTPWEMRAGDPDWSPDGSWIVFGTHPLRGHDEGVSNLYLVRPDGTDMRQLTHFGEGDARAVHPRWTPDGDAIVYARIGATGSSREIWAISAGGTDDAIAVPPHSGRLSTHPAVQPDNPKTSDNGPWIVYQAEFADGTNLGLIRSDGTDDHRIPGGPANRWHPSWSPDGTRIVYDWNTPDDTAEIAVLSLDGSEEERSLLSCVAPCLGNGGPAWSPDGKVIGFDGAESSTAEHDGDLCYLATLDLGSGEVTRFLEHADCEFADSYLQFSPDGQRVVFQRQGPQGQAIFSAAIDGEDERQLTDWGAWARADWSPDGQWIVFQDREPDSHPGEVISLYRVRFDGTGMERLTDREQGYSDKYPRYVPDGSAILFSRCREAEPCDTRLIDPNGQNDRILIPAFRFDVVHVVWQPSP